MEKENMESRTVLNAFFLSNPFAVARLRRLFRLQQEHAVCFSPGKHFLFSRQPCNPFTKATRNVQC
jgi:hypothetical protein